MKRKRSILWRAALLLLALTCASTSVLFTQAKYITSGSFPASITTSKIYGTITPGANPTDVPEGRWLYYVRGDNGAPGTVDPWNPGGQGAEVYGMFITTATSGSSFYLGTAPGGTTTGGAPLVSGKGGNGHFIRVNTTDLPNPSTGLSYTVGSTTYGGIPPVNNTSSVLAVAGGGGGGGYGDGYGGWAGGTGGPYPVPLFAVNYIPNRDIPLKNAFGTSFGWQAWDPADDSKKPENRSFAVTDANDGDKAPGGGGSTQGGDRAKNNSEAGQWFRGGNGQANSHGAGGGGGLWGGGGGSGSAGINSGGGGSSFNNGDICTYAPEKDTKIGDTVTYRNQEIMDDYEEAALAYFYYLMGLPIQGVTSTYPRLPGSTLPDTSYSGPWRPNHILIWLGPDPTAP